MGFATNELRMILRAGNRHRRVVGLGGVRSADQGNWAEALVLIVLAIRLLLFAATIAVSPGVSFNRGSIVVSPKMLFVFIVAPLAGLGLAGVWSASRVLLTALTPVEKSGEF